MSITVWGLFAPLFRYAKPRIALPTQPFFSRSANGFGVDKMEESDANPASSHSARRPLPDEQPDPDQSPNIESIARSYMDALKERLQSAMHIGEGMLFYGSPTLDDDIEKPHELGSILLMETLLASVVLTFPRQAPIRRSVKARLGLLSHALQQTMALPLWTRIPLLIIPCIFLCEIFISMLYLNINVGE
ncbi:hypothetical protein EDB87DRAFT_1601548 [Lactarius vividus]|nr:hypothetical protein EDB87DRAFT_1601548 [Lactarius vividus]